MSYLKELKDLMLAEVLVSRSEELVFTVLYLERVAAHL